MPATNSAFDPAITPVTINAPPHKTTIAPLISRARRPRWSMLHASPERDFDKSDFGASFISMAGRPVASRGFGRLYPPLLASHIILAIVALPMVLVTFFYSLSGRIPQHRKIARWTFPLWLYVSVTGVITYVMLRLAS